MTLYFRKLKSSPIPLCYHQCRSRGFWKSTIM